MPMPEKTETTLNEELMKLLPKHLDAMVDNIRASVNTPSDLETIEDKLRKSKDGSLVLNFSATLDMTGAQPTGRIKLRYGQPVIRERSWSLDEPDPNQGTLPLNP